MSGEKVGGMTRGEMSGGKVVSAGAWEDILYRFWSCTEMGWCLKWDTGNFWTVAMDLEVSRLRTKYESLAFDLERSDLTQTKSPT